MTPDEWASIAAALGYEDSLQLWTTLYVTQHKTIDAISEFLGVTRATVRAELTSHGIEARKRGGRFHWKLKISDDQLYSEVQDFGITDVADHHGVSRSCVYNRYRKIKTRKDLEAANKALAEKSQP